MAEEQEKRVIRIRVRTPEDFVYMGTITMTSDGQQVKEFHGIAGDREEIRSRTMHEPVRDFVKWKESMLFNERCDKSRTQDFERVLGRITKNFDYIDKLRMMIRGKKVDQVRYDLDQELQLSLGIKEGEIEVFAQETNPEVFEGEDQAEETGAGGEAAPERDFSGQIALSFIVAPTNGVPLTQLKDGDQVVARFVDPDEEQTSNYMISRGLKKTPAADIDGDTPDVMPVPGEVLLPDEDPKKPETNATIRSIEPYEGNKTLLMVDLPEDASGYILEEEKSVKVKVPEGAAPPKPAAEDTPEKPKSAGKETPAGKPAAARADGESMDLRTMLMVGAAIAAFLFLMFLILA